jgi:hypothetical protein
MYLGSVARDLFPKVLTLSDPMAGSIAYVMGFFIALIMWGFGILWLCIALVTIYQSRPFPFNMGWWGFTFPLGVFSASTIQLGIEMPSLFFKVLGTVRYFPRISTDIIAIYYWFLLLIFRLQIFSTAVILLWIVAAAGTVRGAWNGKLFYAPCLANLKAKGGVDGVDEIARKVA